MSDDLTLKGTGPVPGGEGTAFGGQASRSGGARMSQADLRLKRAVDIVFGRADLYLCPAAIDPGCCDHSNRFAGTRTFLSRAGWLAWPPLHHVEVSDPICRQGRSRRALSGNHF